MERKVMKKIILLYIFILPLLLSASQYGDYVVFNYRTNSIYNIQKNSLVYYVSGLELASSLGYYTNNLVHWYDAVYYDSINYTNGYNASFYRHNITRWKDLISDKDLFAYRGTNENGVLEYAPIERIITKENTFADKVGYAHENGYIQLGNYNTIGEEKLPLIMSTKAPLDRLSNYIVDITYRFIFTPRLNTDESLTIFSNIDFSQGRRFGNNDLGVGVFSTPSLILANMEYLNNPQGTNIDEMYDNTYTNVNCIYSNSQWNVSVDGIKTNFNGLSSINGLYYNCDNVYSYDYRFRTYLKLCPFGNPLYEDNSYDNISYENSINGYYQNLKYSLSKTFQLPNASYRLTPVNATNAVSYKYSIISSSGCATDNVRDQPDAPIIFNYSRLPSQETNICNSLFFTDGIFMSSIFKNIRNNDISFIHNSIGDIWPVPGFHIGGIPYMTNIKGTSLMDYSTDDSYYYEEEYYNRYGLVQSKSYPYSVAYNVKRLQNIIQIIGIRIYKIDDNDKPDITEAISRQNYEADIRRQYFKYDN
jgi:hypothetical protein